MTTRVDVKLTTRPVYDGHNYSNGCVFAHPAATLWLIWYRTRREPVSITHRYRVV